MTCMPRSCYFFTLLGLVFALGEPMRAVADPQVLNKAVELNKQALDFYKNSELDSAISALKQANELCAVEGLDRHPIVARTHIHLGIVYVGGLKNRDQGVKEFRIALGIDPNIRLTKSLITPEAQAAFDEAVTKGGMASTNDAPPPPAPSSGSGEKAGFLGIIHPPVSTAGMGEAIDIKAQVPSGIPAEKVTLYYRSGETGEFDRRDMRPTQGASGWYLEQIPAEATQGADISYYIEALARGGKVLGQSGRPTAPHVVRLQSTGSGGGAASGGDSPAPLFFGLAVGGGGGYYSGSPEMNPKNGSAVLKKSGIAVAKMGHLAPEIGYFPNDHMLLSLQGRFQYVTGSQDVIKGGKTYKTTKLALAGLLKLSWILADPEAAFQPFVALQGGFGEIRYAIQTVPLEGCGANGAEAPCKDTVRGGLGLLGASAGFLYMVSDGIGFYTSLNGLGSVPDLMFNTDLNVGLAFIK